MVSIICCWNDEKQYSVMKESLRNQDIEYELVGIDNRSNKFRSAASALNVGGGIASGDILIFIHQDIVFERTNSLRNLTEAICSEQKLIVGLYGAFHKKKETTPNGLLLVEALDECCVGMWRSAWEKMKYNEQLCDDWHLYVVELCIRARRLGYSIASGDFSIKHLSIGTVNEKYMETFKRLLMVYRDEKWIATTCKSMPTQLAVFNIYYFMWKIKKAMFGNFPLMYRIRRLLQHK